MRKVKTALSTFLLVLLGIMQSAALSAQDYMLKVGDKVTTEDGIYVVKGQNLVTNPEFNDGLNGWKAGNGTDLSADNFEIVADGGPDGSACLHSLKGAGSGTAQSVKTGWAIEQGKTYVFCCWAYRTQAGMSSNTQYSKIFLSSSETGTNSQIGSINYVGNTWTKTQIVFTATDSYLVVNLGWLNAASSFDCFYLGEVEKSTEVSYTKLEAAIADAKDLLATTEEGNERGQYPATVRQTLTSAITTAETALSATTQDDVNAATTALLAAISAYKGAIVPPFKVGVGYMFTNEFGGMNLTSGTGTVQIATPDANDSTQVFYFVPAPEGAAAVGYNIHDANGTYIFRQGSWDTKSGTVDLTTANAIFNIVDYGTYVQIKNEGSGSVLGVDAGTNGAGVWSNKNGLNAKNNWTISVHTPTAALESKIAEAKKLIAETEVGTEYWQVSQAGMDALVQAVAKAEAALKTVSTFEEAAAEAKLLSDAIATFKTAFNPLPVFDASQNYVLTHYSGNVLTATETGNATITAKAETGASDEQLVNFEKVDYQGLANVYRLRSVATGKYLSRIGDYNTEWTAADTVASYIQVNQLDGKYLGLAFVTTNSYVGSDANTSGSPLYSDKAGEGNTGAYWTIAENITIVLDRVAFNAAVEKANEAAGAMVEGFKKGQYFAEDIAAFRAAISAARTKANKCMSQEELDAVTAQLLADIETYKAKAHTEDVLNKAPLTAAVTAAEVALSKAVAGDFDGQYPQTAIDAYNAVLASAKTVLDNVEATQEQLDAATESLTTAATTFAQAKVSIDYAALSTQIADAKKAVADAEPFKGEGAGYYPASAFETLQVAIDHAEALKKENKCNQATVDAEVETLQNAVITFSNSRVANDYTELQQLVNTAEELIRKAEAGEIVYEQEYLDDLKASYTKNSAALESTDQAVIDRAAKMLSRDIALFRLNVEETTGIDSLHMLPADAKVQIFTLDGKHVSAASSLKRGVYVVRITLDGTTVVKKISVK